MGCLEDIHVQQVGMVFHQEFTLFPFCVAGKEHRELAELHPDNESVVVLIVRTRIIYGVRRKNHERYTIDSDWVRRRSLRLDAPLLQYSPNRVVRCSIRQ